MPCLSARSRAPPPPMSPFSYFFLYQCAPPLWLCSALGSEAADARGHMDALWLFPLISLFSLRDLLLPAPRPSLRGTSRALFGAHARPECACFPHWNHHARFHRSLCTRWGWIRDPRLLSSTGRRLIQSCVVPRGRDVSGGLHGALVDLLAAQFPPHQPEVPAHWQQLPARGGELPAGQCGRMRREPRHQTQRGGGGQHPNRAALL